MTKEGEIMIKLVGVVIVIIGLLLKLNPLLVVILAGVATGLAGGMDLLAILTTIGDAFTTNRYMSLFVLIMPVIGLMERHGLREQAGNFIRGFRNLTAGRIMMLYMLFRQVTLALGINIGGHPNFIRPIVSPMAEAAAAKGKALPRDLQDQVRSYAASSENYGNFYGQLMFIATGGLLLIKGVFTSAGYTVELGKMALYAIPTAVCAFLLVALRFTLFDRKIAARMKDIPAETKGGEDK